MIDSSTSSASIRAGIRAGIARMNQSKDSALPPTATPEAPTPEATERAPENPAMLKMPLVVDTGRRPPLHAPPSDNEGSSL